MLITPVCTLQMLLNPVCTKINDLIIQNHFPQKEINNEHVHYFRFMENTGDITILPGLLAVTVAIMKHLKHKFFIILPAAYSDLQYFQEPFVDSLSQNNN